MQATFNFLCNVPLCKWYSWNRHKGAGASLGLFYSGGVRVSICRQDVNLLIAPLHFFRYKFCTKVDPLKICAAKRDKKKRTDQTYSSQVTYKRTAKMRKAPHTSVSVATWMPPHPQVATGMPTCSYATAPSTFCRRTQFCRQCLRTGGVTPPHPPLDTALQGSQCHLCPFVVVRQNSPEHNTKGSDPSLSSSSTLNL